MMKSNYRPIEKMACGLMVQVHEWNVGMTSIPSVSLGAPRYIKMTIAT